jgi:nitrate/nitrite-specific signal transduction histidine kinase
LFRSLSVWPVGSKAKEKETKVELTSSLQCGIVLCFLVLPFLVLRFLPLERVSPLLLLRSSVSQRTKHGSNLETRVQVRNRKERELRALSALFTRLDLTETCS